MLGNIIPDFPGQIRFYGEQMILLVYKPRREGTQLSYGLPWEAGGRGTPGWGLLGAQPHTTSSATTASLVLTTPSRAWITVLIFMSRSEPQTLGRVGWQAGKLPLEVGEVPVEEWAVGGCFASTERPHQLRRSSALTPVTEPSLSEHCGCNIKPQIGQNKSLKIVFSGDYTGW